MRTDFPKLSALLESNNVVEIESADPELTKEVQTILKRVELYKGEIDGKPGNQTKSALAEFKEQVWLKNPTQIGKSTAASLLEVADGKDSSSDESDNTKQQPLPSEVLDSKTGPSMTLPDGTVVYANEFIVSGIPLTWGEFTDNCNRVLKETAYIANAKRLARGFGEIREKWGSPIAINSGYRPPNVNRAVRGARNSQHLYARAIDIRPLNGDIYNLLKVVKASSAVGVGLGMRKGFIHVDYRDGDRVVFPY